MKLKSGIDVEITEFKDNEKTREGLYNSLALCYPPGVVEHGGWSYEEVDHIFDNRMPRTCLIAITDAKNVDESDVQMLYRDAWATRVDEGMCSEDFAIIETANAAQDILKTSPLEYLERSSHKAFGIPKGKIFAGNVLAYFVPENACQDSLWGGSCPSKSEKCTNGKYGYLYHILSTKRGVGSALGGIVTSNLFENGVEVVSEHSRAEGYSQNLFGKLGYVKKGIIKGFLPGGGDAVPMCITKERYEEMKPKYSALGLI